MGCQSISDGGMKINTYFIAVLGLATTKNKESQNAGLIEWVENVTTFKSCLTDVYSITGTEYQRWGSNRDNFPFEWPANFLGGGLIHKHDAFQNMKYCGIKEVPNLP